MNNPSEQKKIEKFFRLTSDTFCGMVLSADKTQNTNEVAKITIRSVADGIPGVRFDLKFEPHTTTPTQTNGFGGANIKPEGEALKQARVWCTSAPVSFLFSDLVECGVAIFRHIRLRILKVDFSVQYMGQRE